MGREFWNKALGGFETWNLAAKLLHRHSRREHYPIAEAAAKRRKITAHGASRG